MKQITYLAIFLLIASFALATGDTNNDGIVTSCEVMEAYEEWTKFDTIGVADFVEIVQNQRADAPCPPFIHTDDEEFYVNGEIDLRRLESHLDQNFDDIISGCEILSFIIARINIFYEHPDLLDAAIELFNQQSQCFDIEIPPNYFMRGDVNNDQRRDISDAIAILEYLFVNNNPPHCYDAADVDDNGVIDISDSVYLLNGLFNDAQRYPFKEPLEIGPDPTDDHLTCLSLFCEDLDGDGYYASTASCQEGNDCDDTSPQAYPGAAEMCDQIDNNCNGQVDETGASHLCLLQQGVCTGARAFCSGAKCNSENYGPNYESEESLCDGLDNDCDGQIDEGCECISGETRGCGSFIGVCSEGIQTCTNGVWSACEGAVEPSVEICDGIDNDCDGTIDETCNDEITIVELLECIQDWKNYELTSAEVTACFNRWGGTGAIFIEATPENARIYYEEGSVGGSREAFIRNGMFDLPDPMFIAADAPGYLMQGRIFTETNTVLVIQKFNLRQGACEPADRDCNGVVDLQELLTCRRNLKMG